MSEVRLSSNILRSVPFPLVLGDRFFTLYEGPDGRLSLDVFRWDEPTATAVYEIRRGVPIIENIENNPTAVVTFGDGTGGFGYKLLPKPGGGPMLGKVPGGEEYSVHCGDRSLTVMCGEMFVVDAVNNFIRGCAIGVKVGMDGSVAFGVNDLPEGMRLSIGPAVRV
jgi:hypothetical protein